MTSSPLPRSSPPPRTQGAVFEALIDQLFDDHPPPGESPASPLPAEEEEGDGT